MLAQISNSFFDPALDWARMANTEINTDGANQRKLCNDIAAGIPCKIVCFIRWGPDVDPTGMVTLSHHRARGLSHPPSRHWMEMVSPTQQPTPRPSFTSRIDTLRHDSRRKLLESPSFGAPFGYTFISETAGLVEQHNLFRSADGHIHALWFNFAEGWHREDRTTLLSGTRKSG